MASIQAFIRVTDKQNKNISVRFRLRDGRNIQLFHKSEIVVSPDTWDTKEQCIKKRILFRESERERINNAIRDRKYLILDIFEKAPDKEGLSSEWLETEIDKKLHPEKYAPETIDTLFKFTDKFIADASKRKNRKTGRLVGDSIKRQYKSFSKILKLFAESVNKKDFHFKEIDQKFYDDFINYLQSEKQIEYKNGNVAKLIRKSSTIASKIRLLRTILNEATKQGYNIYTHHIEINTYIENVDSVYLSEDELQLLKDIDLSSSLSLEYVRDHFLLLAWTGCRYSDLDKIVTNEIRDGFITFRQQKTNNKVTIPLHPVVQGILEKYNYNIPKSFSLGLFNTYIKQVAKFAGIDTPETITFTRGGKLVTEHHPKYELVSSHTGRRSFCTNMYKRGLPTLMIMSISGHTTETSFLKYIKVRQSEHAEMMKKAWEDIYK